MLSVRSAGGVAGDSKVEVGVSALTYVKCTDLLLACVREYEILTFEPISK